MRHRADRWKRCVGFGGFSEVWAGRCQPRNLYMLCSFVLDSHASAMFPAIQTLKVQVFAIVCQRCAVFGCLSGKDALSL
jgi:hypothetical protein